MLEYLDEVCVTDQKDATRDVRQVWALKVFRPMSANLINQERLDNWQIYVVLACFAAKLSV